MAGSKPIVWRVEIAPEEFKLFGDCNRDELETAATLIKDRLGVEASRPQVNFTRTRPPGSG